RSQVLHQKEIDLIAVRVYFVFFFQVARDDGAEVFFRTQPRGLQQLAKLMDVDAFVHLVEPCPDPVDGLRLSAIDRRLQLGTGAYTKIEFLLPRAVQNVEAARIAPL